MNPTLPDILEGELDIVFVGINPGRYSAKMGHYYAQPANRFWHILFQSGLIPSPLKPDDDWKLPRFGMGLTDVVKRVTPGSNDLSLAELKEGGEILRHKIGFYQPRVVCFNGLTGYRAVFQEMGGLGLKSHKIHKSSVFALPSTSPRNTHYTKDKLILLLKQLHQFQGKNLL